MTDHDADVNETNSVVSQNSVPAEGNSISASDELDTDFSHQDHNSINETPSLKDLAARYLMKIKEGNKLSNKATQNIVGATSLLFDIAFDRLEK